MEKAFVSADGWGQDATGGRDGRFLLVNRTDDPELTVELVNSMNAVGQGSFRWAILSEFPRIIGFKISGWITLSSQITVRQENSNFTLLGMISPLKGVGVRGFGLKFYGVTNFIIRYLRIRLGNSLVNQDSLDIRRGCQNYILDHCSLSWGGDEGLSMYAVRNYTVQNCIISETLTDNHRYGGIWGGKNGSFKLNLIMNMQDRMPRFDSPETYNSEFPVADWRGVLDVTNIVMYNTSGRFSNGGAGGTFNLENCYYKNGPSGNTSRILAPTTVDVSITPYGIWYLNGNVLEGNSGVTADNWTGVGLESTALTNAYKDSCKSDVQFSAPKRGSLLTAEQALSEVLANCGASIQRDDVDIRLMNELENGTATFGNGQVNTTQEPNVVVYPDLGNGNLDMGPMGNGITQSMIDDYSLNTNLNYTDEGDIVTAPHRFLDINGFTYNVYEVQSMRITGEILPVIAPQTEFNLTLINSDELLGTVDRNVNNPITGGQAVELTATPITGYQVQWRQDSIIGNILSQDLTYNHIMNSDITIVAVFVQQSIPPGPLKKFRLRFPKQPIT